MSKKIGRREAGRKPLKSAQKRKQWRVKRTLTVVLGWALMGFMVYLILVTQRTVIKIWNPYDILGISDVSLPLKCMSTSFQYVGMN